MNKVFSFFRATATGRVLIPIGIILTVFGFLLIPIVNQSKDWERTEATVTRTELAQPEYEENGEHHDATYSTYVKYEAENESHEVLLGELSGYREGDTLKIIYNPENPEMISQPVGMVFPFALIGAGILALIGGIASLAAAVKKHKTLRQQEKEWNNGKEVLFSA